MEKRIQQYLEDAIAAEKSFETQLRTFADEATYESAKSAFATHADETRQQYESLTARLQVLGGEPSSMKSMMAHIFNMAPKTAQIGHEDEERTTQDLMMAFSVENAEVAMYESLIIAADAEGDRQTVDIARRIQDQEKATAQKVWGLIRPAAADACQQVISGNSESPKDLIVRYLQDAEAAERNFEDALASFSKMGDRSEVQGLLSMMSQKARTQHERLESRIQELGASRSEMKSMLAHMLAFTPVSAQLGHTASEKNTQHLMITYAAASAEMAMYEALAATAETLGDEQTLRLARELQAEEKEDHRLAWEHLGRSARESLVTA